MIKSRKCNIFDNMCRRLCDRMQTKVKVAEKEKIFKALGDANRLIIMDLLKGTELSAGRILQQVKMGQSTLSHHMKILCDSGIVNARKDSRWVYYTINSDVVKQISADTLGWL